jgi:hypothetical protein
MGTLFIQHTTRKAPALKGVQNNVGLMLMNVMLLNAVILGSHTGGRRI